MEKIKNQKIGLALGSGGFRGLAHIGVIKVLLKNNIPIDFISGSSAGSLVGSYFAFFGEVDSLEKLVLENSKDFLPIFLDFSFTGGFVKGNKLKKYLEKIYNKAQFSETRIPFVSVATDLISGQPVVISSGKLIPAIMGSMSVPVVFKPIIFGNKYLVDGGLSDPVPVSVLRKMGADNVIAVNLYHNNEFKLKKFTFSRVVLRSTRIVLHNLSKISVKEADCVLNPDTSMYLNKMKISDYLKPQNIKKIIDLGEKEATLLLPEINKKLGLIKL